MPKTFDRAPELPKMRRRIGRDTTELLITMLALLSTAGIVAVLIRTSVFDITSQDEYNFIKYFLICTSAFLWLTVVRLEFTAKNKAEILYETQMKEYEIMRAKWLDIASQKMEIEAKRSMDYSNLVQPSVVSSKPVEIKQVIAEKTESDSKSDVSAQQNGLGKAKNSTPKIVKMSILEYDDKIVPIPLFAASLGMITGFTFIFPWMGLVTVPIASFIIFSIVVGDITFVDIPSSPERNILEEEQVSSIDGFWVLSKISCNVLLMGLKSASTDFKKF